MAGITKLSNGRRLQFTLNGDRKQIWLGKMNADDADRVMRRVEDLAAATMEGRAPKPATSEWLGEQSNKFKKKLAAHGLCQVVERIDSPTVKDIIELWRAKKFGGYAENTIRNHEAVFANLEAYFLPTTRLDSITEGDADDYADWLANTRRPKLGEVSARSDCKVAKKLFRHARRKRWIVANPFDEVSTGNLANRDRFQFVAEDIAKAVLKELPGTQWPLLFALGRWGGLRIHSDALGLRWEGVDWARRRLTLWAKKTKSWRTVPIFSELMPLLEQRHQSAETGEGAELVVPMVASWGKRVRRGPLVTAVSRAKVDRWPKLWQNLRATRDNELELQGHRRTAVRAWIGHTEDVAAGHYLNVTDEDFAQAIGG